MCEGEPALEVTSSEQLQCMATLEHENTSPCEIWSGPAIPPPRVTSPRARQALPAGLAVYAMHVWRRLKTECAQCETAAEYAEAESKTAAEHSEVGHAADSVHLRSEVSAAHQATYAAPGRHETSSLASGKPLVRLYKKEV